MFIPQNSAAESALRAEPLAYDFGSFTLDLQRAVLLKSGEAVDLRPKTFDVLRVLVEHPQQLLERETIMRAVWPGLVVTDDSLTQCLTEIRRALGDDERTMIRTVPRRGYRFELPVQVQFAEGRGTPAAAAASVAAGKRRPSPWTLAALGLLVLAVTAAWWRAGTGPEPAATELAEWRPPPASVAVLAFADMSPEGDQAFLADGLAEEILNILAQQDALTVISRTSSFALRGENLDVGTIARRLNVSHVLEGSVRRAGDRVRITAQLIDGQSGAHVWSESFDRQLDDLFATQDEIAGAVASVLSQRLLGALGLAQGDRQAAGYRPDREAWELYLRGRYLYGRRMAGDRVEAQRYFEQALRIDPAFAAAWVALAAIYNVRAGDPDMPDDERLSAEEARPLMREALTRALELEPAHPEALLRMAGFDLAEGRSDAALDKMERAMRFGRNNALVQSMLGGLASSLGDPHTGAELQGRAVRLDPLSATHVSNYGHFLYYAGRLVEADLALSEALTLNPQISGQVLPERALIAIQRGDLDTATTLAEALPEGARRDLVLALLADARGNREDSDAALGRIRSSLDTERSSYVAAVLAARGDRDAAFAALDLTVDDLLVLPNRNQARHQLMQLRSSPLLVSLHDDPRWQDWERRVIDSVGRPDAALLLARIRSYLSESPGQA